jgi:hypothetical protein
MLEEVEEKGVSDLIRLDIMTEETVLQNLRVRYQRKEIYVCVSVCSLFFFLFFIFHQLFIYLFIFPFGRQTHTLIYKYIYMITDFYGQYIDKCESVSISSYLWSRCGKGV